MKVFLILTAILITVITTIFFVQGDETYVLSIDNKVITTIVVDNNSTRTKGLSGMETLPKDIVMLFVFDTPDIHGIWMKDMKFAIDIVWLDASGKIVWLESNVSPDTYPKVFFPPEKSLYTIEGKSGFIEQNLLTVGKILSVVKK